MKSLATKIPATLLLPELYRVLQLLRSTTLSTEKTRILFTNRDRLEGFLRYFCKVGPLHITSNAILDKPSMVDAMERRASCLPEFTFMEDLLDALASKSISGHLAIAAVQKFICQHQQYTTLILDIIDKDLKVRMGSKSILKGLGEERIDNGDPIGFSVALAESFAKSSVQKFMLESLGKGEVWLASRKLDGVRGILRIDRAANNIHLFSRHGKPIRLPLLFSAADTINWFRDVDSSVVYLDGELCYFPTGPEGKEEFSQISRLCKMEGQTSWSDQVYFSVFDCLTESEFAHKAAESKCLTERLKRLDNLPQDLNIVKLPQQRVYSLAEVKWMQEEGKNLGWEGVIVRRDAKYSGKRSKDMIKFKDFLDGEFTVFGYTLSPMRIVEGGMERNETLLAALQIKYKGSIVNVGSGFDLAQRRQYAAIGDGLIGCTVTIVYFTESMNRKSGQRSLRFPVFKELYLQGRDL